MIKKVLYNNLKKCFLKINFKENKGSELSVNEWSFIDSNLNKEQSYLINEFSIEALFKKGDYNRIVLDKNEFINYLQQFFIINSMEIEKTTEGRIKMILSLKQATCEV